MQHFHKHDEEMDAKSRGMQMGPRQLKAWWCEVQGKMQHFHKHDEENDKKSHGVQMGPRQLKALKATAMSDRRNNNNNKNPFVKKNIMRK